MKKQPLFNRTDFPELTDELRNPFRGWYQIYPFCVEKEPDFEELIWCLRKEETCALVLLDIGTYRDCDLDETALNHIEQIFSFFDEQKKDILLRVAYDREGKGAEHEPSLLSRVIAHIGQLEPLIQRYCRRIVFFEGMFIGSWGEMHGSRFLTKDNMLQLNEALAKSTAGIFRAVRRPVQWRMLHQEPPSVETAVALYDDAIFGSDTDLGTFAQENYASEEWEEPWSKERELEFEEQLGAFVPQCGEAVYGEEDSDYTLESAVERLRRMNLTCLNGVYDEKILNLWKEWNWNAPDVWQGMNGYDYIGRHLGYRFCVRSAEAHAEWRHCRISLTLENVGFSGFYQEAEALLILTDKTGKTREYLTEWDAKALKSGQKQTLTWRIPRREGKIYFSIRRKWDRETVWLSNPSTEKGWVMIEDLKR